MTVPGTITISPRIQIRQELKETRQEFHALLDSLDESDWHLPSDNPAWTIGEVLCHLVLGINIINLEIKTVRRKINYPKPSRALFDYLNIQLTRMWARYNPPQKIGRAYDKAHASLLRTLNRITSDEWEMATKYPAFDTLLMNQYITIEDIFHYPKQHFQAHQAEINGGLEIFEKAEQLRQEQPAGEYEQQAFGLMEYPSGGWRKAFFKAPIFFWRLGLAPLMGNIFMLITQTGRKSGIPRRTMVEYHSRAGVKFVACAFGEKADWYQNILADPYVTIQTAKGCERAITSRVSDDRELLTVYNLFIRRDPPLMKWYLGSLDIQANPLDVLYKKERIYWLRFDPTQAPTPPPQKADLAWIWLFALLGGILAWLLSKQKRSQ